MPTTIYSFHRASDDEIIASAEPCFLQRKAAEIALRIHRGLPDADLRRTPVYIHNGRGIIGAGICREGLWHDTDRDPYMAREPHASALRTAAGFPLDPPTDPAPLQRFAVEYRSATGRLRRHEVAARNADDAMHRTVDALGIDFAAIQTTEAVKG